MEITYEPAEQPELQPLEFWWWEDLDGVQELVNEGWLEQEYQKQLDEQSRVDDKF